MKLRKNKKGFTIVELVIVIAVIGVLAAVLIPTFVNLTNKANKAADEALVNNLNKALKMEEAEAGHEKAQTLEGAIVDLEKEGFILENLVSKSGQDLVWNQEKNEFKLAESGDQGPKFWKIANNVTGDEKYSIYAGKNFDQTAVAGLKYGFDVGRNNTISSIEYVGTGYTQEVAIRTNTANTDLSINAPTDTVNHFGDVGNVNVISVDRDHCYNENGKAAFLTLVEGKVVAKPTGTISVLYVNPTEGTEIKVQVQKESGGAITVGFANSAAVAEVIAEASGIELDSSKTAEQIKEIGEEAKLLAANVAIVDGTYQLTLEAAFTKAVTMENPVIEIINDIDLSGTKWGFDLESHPNVRSLTINGNNHIIKNLTVSVAATNDPKGEIGAGNSNYYGVGFIQRVNPNQSVAISNLTFDKADINDKGMNNNHDHHTSQVALLIGVNRGRASFTNINVVNSSIFGGEKVAVFVGHHGNGGTDTKLDILNCSVKNTSVKGFVFAVAPTVGYCDSQTMTVENLELYNNTVALDTAHRLYEFGGQKTSIENGIYFINDGDWTLGTAEFGYRAGYNRDSQSNKIKVTKNNLTLDSYGSEIEFVKNGNLYSTL